MTSAKFIFILMCLLFFVVVPLFIKRRKLYFIGLASSLYVFSSGWIFYHFNGIMLGDIPIFILLVLAATSHRKVDILVKPIGIPLMLLILCFLLSAIGAIRPGWVVSETTKYFRMLLLIIGIANNLNSMRELRAAIMGMFIGLLIQAAIGIYQWRYGALGIWFLGERPANRISWRTMGTFFVPSFYANYLALMLPLAFRMFIYYRPPKQKMIYFYGAIFCLATLALFTTYGRGPWIGVAAAISVIIFLSMFTHKFRSKIRRTIPFFIVFSLIFTLRYGGKIINQFTSSRKASTEVRFPQFRIAWRVIKGNPVLGVGLGNYDLNSWNYMTPDELRNPSARVFAMMVHNVYLYVTAETGFTGGILLICWYISIFVTCAQILKSKIINDYIINITMGILGGMLAIVIIFTFSPDIHAYQLLYQMGLFCGILIGMKRLIKNAQRLKRLKKYRKFMDQNDRQSIKGIKKSSAV